MKHDITINARPALTIWELLCVLFVIFLLFTLLMPALFRVRTQSTRIICESNLKQYGLAGILYTSDNDGKFPDQKNEWFYSEKSFDQEHPLGCRWHDMAMASNEKIMTNNLEYKGMMWEYFDHDSQKICPQFRSIARYRGCENPEHNNSININPQYSYTMNGYLGTTRAGGVLKDSEIRDSSEVFFFAEENSWTLRPDHPKFPAKWLSKPLSTQALDDTLLLISSTSQARDCFATYHGAKSGDVNRGFGNVVFIDGHVDRITIEEQLEQKERGWPQDTTGNLSLAWASKELPGSNSDTD